VSASSLPPLIPILVNGLLAGGTYGLIAVGLTLIFGVFGMFNVMHGTLVMLSGYMTYWLFALIGINPYLSAPIVFVSFFFIGLAIDRGILGRVMSGGTIGVFGPSIRVFLLTLGLLYLLENVAMYFWGASYRAIELPYSSFSFFDISVNVSQLLGFITAIVVTIALAYWLRSRVGSAVRAAAEDYTLALLSGINVSHVESITFGLYAGITGLGGVLLVTFTYVFPQIALSYTLMGMIIVVLGGLGSIKGALVGGIIVGIAQSLTVYYLSGQLVPIVFYSILLLTLILRPGGIFGRK
jgi:branched-chain amino acid transport system permease protein